MVGFEHREEAERLQGIRRLRDESRDPPSFPTMYGGREALPDDHKFRGRRGRVRARYRRPQRGRGTEKIGETLQRKTNLQLASGAFSCKVAPFTPAGERTKKAPSYMLAKAFWQVLVKGRMRRQFPSGESGGWIVSFHSVPAAFCPRSLSGCHPPRSPTERAAARTLEKP